MKPKAKAVFAVIFVIAPFIGFSTMNLKAQTGGPFDLSHNVIASGGGSNSTGGQFSLSGTAGQNSAGTVSSGGGFSLQSGFWAIDLLTPTAASVAVSGRVTTANGQGIRNIEITLTDANGLVRTRQTASLGYYRFDEVPVGQSYILQVSSRRFTFSNPTRVLDVQTEIADADFVAEP